MPAKLEVSGDQEVHLTITYTQTSLPYHKNLVQNGVDYDC